MNDPMIKLYQAEWCPYCRDVRMKLTDLEVNYLTVNVPRAKEDRDELFRISGQRGIPTLVHGDLVIADDDDAIIDYLETRYSQDSKRVSRKVEGMGVLI